MLSARIQRMMMGTVLVLALYLFNTQEVMMASVILTGVIALVYIWAIFDFCPSLCVLEKVLKEGCKTPNKDK